MLLTDTAIRNAKPKDKQYKLSDERGLYPRSLFPHFFIFAGKGISFDPMVANTFLLCEDASMRFMRNTRNKSMRKMDKMWA